MFPLLAWAFALAFSYLSTAASVNWPAFAFVDSAVSATLHAEKIGRFRGCSEERDFGAGLEKGDWLAKTSLRQLCVGNRVGMLLLATLAL
jgi:hypothetical protein